MLSIKQQWELEQREALNALIDWAGDAATLGKLLGESTATVNNWQMRGRMSARCACKCDGVDGCPLTKEQIRPDVINWHCEDYI